MFEATERVSEPGCYTISAPSYHKDPAPSPSLSRSVLTTLLTRSPYHAYLEHPRLNRGHERTTKTEFDIGTAAHALLIEGESSFIEIDAADYRTTAAKRARDDAYANVKTPLLSSQADRVRAMVKAARAQLRHHPDADEAFRRWRERTLIVQDPQHKVWLRARPDDMPVTGDGNLLFDYKTTTNASPDVWWRRAFDHHLHWQEAFYCRVYEALFEVDQAYMRFVVQETTPPYALAVFEFHPAAREIARIEVEEGIRRWAWCVIKGHWGGYTARVHTMEPPPWILRQYEDSVVRRQYAEDHHKELLDLAIEMQAPPGFGETGAITWE